MSRIAVEYCAPCRAGGDAVATRRALLGWLRECEDLSPGDVSLEPRAEPGLCVSVDDERVWCAGDRVDPIEAVNAVRSRLTG